MLNVAVYYHHRNDGYIHPCGSFSVLSIDGRLNHINAAFTAREYGKKHGYSAFSLQRVDSYRDLNLDDNPLINLCSIPE